jgi:hypothetical protein
VEGATPVETVDRLEAMVRSTESLVVERGRQRSGGNEAPPWEAVAGLKLLDLIVALGDDQIAENTGLPPQGTRTRRRPRFLYPRITSPLVAEPSMVRASGGGAARAEYILPVMLNRRAFMRTWESSWLLGEALSSLLLPDAGHDLPPGGAPLIEAVREKLRFVLVPRDRNNLDLIPLDESPDRFIILPDVKNPDPASDTRALTLESREDALSILIRLPVEQVAERWKRIDAAQPGARTREELLDLRIFPRVPLEVGGASGPWREILEAFQAGRWVVARERLAATVKALATVPAPETAHRPRPGDARRLVDGLQAAVKALHGFADDLEPVIVRAEALAEALEEEGLPRDEATARVRDLEMAVAAFIDEDACPAPVLLDEPPPADASFSFIVGADLQYHANGSNLFKFLAMVDPSRAPQAGDSSTAAAELLSPEIAEAVKAAKFILIVGDFGDGAGFSSTGTGPVLDSLGLSPPRSPYASRGDALSGEFPELREQVRRCSKAVFAVPGNHDGFASYGGILNQVTAGLGYVLTVLPIFSPLGDWLVDDASDKLPTLVRVFRITPPFYDGLMDWVYELGPRNLAFNYRGFAYVAMNTFDLHQVERDQVGAVGNNWGGGVQDAARIWFDLALRHFGRLDRGARGLAHVPGGRSFVFLHHDPRAALASKTEYDQDYYGHYNDTTTPFTELTLGYFGLQWSSIAGLFIPLVSPVLGQGIQSMIRGENFQERWMRSTVWDEECYNARGVLEAINRNLEGAPPPPVPDTRPWAPISHLFFGHDDVPSVGPWVHPDGRTVFPNRASDDGWDTVGQQLLGFFFPSQADGPPAWGGRMVFDDGRQASVIRMDDLGDVFDKTNGHGFHLVTVRYPAGPVRGAPPTISVRWIPIPR